MAIWSIMQIGNTIFQLWSWGHFENYSGKSAVSNDPLTKKQLKLELTGRLEASNIIQKPESWRTKSLDFLNEERKQLPFGTELSEKKLRCVRYFAHANKIFSKQSVTWQLKHLSSSTRPKWKITAGVISILDSDRVIITSSRLLRTQEYVCLIRGMSPWDVKYLLDLYCWFNNRYVFFFLYWMRSSGEIQFSKTSESLIPFSMWSAFPLEAT